MAELPTEPRREPEERDWQGGPSNGWLYAVITAVLVALLGVALVTYRTEQASAEAERKAEQLVTRLQAAGFAVRDEQRAQDAAVRLFGADGGRLCESPDTAFMRAALASRLATGGGIASRPVILDRRLFLAEEIVLSVYCPSKLPAFREFVAGLKTGRTLPQ